MKLRKFLIPMIGLAILMSLQGCGQRMVERPNFCDSYRLITVEPKDNLTPHTAQIILHDDDQYEAICH